MSFHLLLFIVTKYSIKRKQYNFLHHAEIKINVSGLIDYSYVAGISFMCTFTLEMVSFLCNGCELCMNRWVTQYARTAYIHVRVMFVQDQYLST